MHTYPGDYRLVPVIVLLPVNEYTKDYPTAAEHSDSVDNEAVGTTVTVMADTPAQCALHRYKTSYKQCHRSPDYPYL